MNIKFHCDEAQNFKKPHILVRAFTYTEYSVEPHTHDFYEINIVMGGRGVHQIESSTFSVGIGDVFVIPPMTTHAYYNTEHLEVYHILIKKELIKSNAAESSTVPGFLQLMEIEPFLRQSCSESVFLHLTLSELSEVKNDIRFIEDDSPFDSEEFTALHNHTVWKIIYYLSFLLRKQIEGDKQNASVKYKYQILDTLEYLHQNFSKKINIDDLASRVYLSRSSFFRGFQAVCGCSPNQYLSRYRTEKAVELSTDNALSKTVVAHLCGFYDLSHMERSIKKLNSNR